LKPVAASVRCFLVPPTLALHSLTESVRFPFHAEPTQNQTIGIEVSLDGKPIGSASIFSNLGTNHRAVVPTYIPLKLTFGEHKLVLSAATSVTISDLNDFFDVVLDY
jgi:hypothetical protein